MHKKQQHRQLYPACMIKTGVRQEGTAEHLMDAHHLQDRLLLHLLEVVQAMLLLDGLHSSNLLLTTGAIAPTLLSAAHVQWKTL